jgi:hypothetical protein
MTYFWLDIKGDVGIFQAIQPIILNAQAHAKAIGRNVLFMQICLPPKLLKNFNPTRPIVQTPV